LDAELSAQQKQIEGLGSTQTETASNLERALNLIGAGDQARSAVAATVTTLETALNTVEDLVGDIALTVNSHAGMIANLIYQTGIMALQITGLRTDANGLRVDVDNLLSRPPSDHPPNPTFRVEKFSNGAMIKDGDGCEDDNGANRYFADVNCPVGTIRTGGGVYCRISGKENGVLTNHPNDSNGWTGGCCGNNDGITYVLCASHVVD